MLERHKDHKNYYTIKEKYASHIIKMEAQFLVESSEFTYINGMPGALAESYNEPSMPEQSCMQLLHSEAGRGGFRRVLRERLAEIPHVLTISLYFQYVSMSQVFH